MCDGSWQCPNGDDETDCENFSCNELFKCTLEAPFVCLHPADVCNEISDCSSGEDEFMCDTPWQCPKECTCLLKAARCEKSMTFTLDLLDFALNFSYFKIISILFSSGHEKGMQHSTDLTVFIWIYSKLKKVCNMFHVLISSLKHVDFSFNEIMSLEKGCFKNAPNMKILILKENKLAKLHSFGTKELQKLDLSKNKLISFLPGIDNFELIILLDVRQNNFEFISNDINQKVAQISGILTDDFRICCFIRQVMTGNCSSVQPVWPFSCQSTFITPVKNIVGIITATMVFCLNTFALLLVLKQRSQYDKLDQTQAQKAAAFLINTLLLSGNDLSLGLNLAVVLVLEKWLSGHSLLLFTKWMGSIPCTLIGAFSMFSLINSYILINCLSVSRLLVVKYPFAQHFKSSHNTMKYLGILITCNAIFCGSITVVLLFMQNNTPLPLCTFLGETQQSSTITLGTLFVALSQWLSFFFFLYCYTSILSEMNKTAEKVTGTFSHNKLQYQIILLGAAHAVCWLPSSFIYFATLVKETYPIEIIVWNTVLVNQLNCIVNPIFYTIAPAVKKFSK